jgi:hypothetical protein
MSLGLGLSLSVLFIGVIYLCKGSQESINYSKIIKILAYLFILVPLVIGLCIVLYNKYTNYPRKTNEYWGIKLGDQKSEIRFFKGGHTDEFIELDKPHITLFVPVKDYRSAAHKVKELQLVSVKKLVSYRDGFALYRASRYEWKSLTKQEKLQTQSMEFEEITCVRILDTAL